MLRNDSGVTHRGGAIKRRAHDVNEIDVCARTPSSVAVAAAITHTLPGTLRAGKSARLNASVDSGGALTYKSRTPSICKVGSAGKVTALSRGTCRVRINVTANGDYDAGKLVVFTTVRR